MTLGAVRAHEPDFTYRRSGSSADVGDPRTVGRPGRIGLLHERIRDAGHAGPVLPLTVRRDDLPHHPGQVSLPGGAIDPGEPPDRAALREAHEEIGITPADVRIVGSLSTLNVIVSNFVVQPFVGVVNGRPEFRLAPHEVASLVEVPLEELRDAGRLGWSRHVREGLIVEYPHFDLAGHQVWGATAMILGEFASLFDPEFGPPPFE